MNTDINALTCFTLSTTAQVAHLVLNKPEALNTMHPTFWRELDTVLAHLHQTGTARALVISSTGKHFSAGMALETFGGAITIDDQSPEGRAAIFDLLTDMQATFTRLENLRIPVIMAIHGGCIGGAVDMVTAGCIRYATQDAFFCIQEINIGMVADVGTLQRLPKLIGQGITRELAYTGRVFGAQEAREIGLLNRVFATREALYEGVQAIAASIAAKSPLSIRGTKEMLNYARDHSVADSLNYIATWNAAMLQSKDLVAAMTASMARQVPQFKD